MMFFIILIISVLVGAALDMFVPSFPEIQQEFFLSPFSTQLMLSLNFVSFSLFSLIVGAVSDKFNKKIILSISLFIFLFGSFLSMVAPSYPYLLLGIILQGLGVAGPGVIIYSLISENYDKDKQVTLIGIMHGITAFAMSAAPIAGSYITHYFGWRHNFFALIVFGSISTLLILIFIPKKSKSQSQISTASFSYMPLLRSRKSISFIITLCFFMAPYWVFVGIAPILYRQELGVSITEFGFYQAALAIVFAIGSSVSGFAIKLIGRKKTFILGSSLCALHVILVTFIILFEIKDPVFITFCMAVASFGVATPINMLYPYTLSIIKDSSGRASAFITGLRMIICSAGLWLVGAFYNKTFAPVGIWIVITMSAALISTAILVRRNRDMLT